MNKKTKIIVASVSFIGINISTLFTATIAWFSTNRKVSAAGMIISARNEDNVGVTSKHIYKYDTENKHAIETSDYTLNAYDCFITLNNENARNFIRLSLYYPNGVPENTRLYVQVDCEGRLFRTVENKTYVDTNISNLVQFKYFDNKNGDIDTSTVDDIYNDCVTVFDSINTYSKFVTLTTSGDDVIGSKPANSIYDNSIILAPTNGVPYQTELFIEYRYNEDLITYYQNNAKEKLDTQVISSAVNLISFTSDIKKITIDTITTNN